MAFSDLDHAIETSPLDHDAYFKRAQAYTGVGETLLALRDLQQAINLAPANVDYLYNRGLLRYELAEYDSAIADFDGAIELKEPYAYVDPRHARPFVGRGTVYLLLGNPKRALDDGNRAIQILEDNFATSEWASYKPAIDRQLADAHELLGDAYTQLGKNEEAQSQYQRAFELR